MSLMFKITIPDGLLKEHLKGLKGTARNFEFNRLATNALMAEQDQEDAAGQSQQAPIKNATASTIPQNEDNRGPAAPEEPDDMHVELDGGADMGDLLIKQMQ